MINEQGLREMWISKGYTQESLANKIGLHVRTFRNRIKKGRLTTTDLDNIIKVLEIENPAIFFYTDK